MAGDFLAALPDVSNDRPYLAASEDEATKRVERVLRSHRRSFSAGTILKMEREPCSETYCMLDGWLALSKSTEDGHRQIIDFMLPGDIMNPASAHRNTSAVQIEGLSQTTVSVIPNVIWANLTEAVPALKWRATCMTASVRSRMSERMLRLGKGNSEMRIAYSLMELFLRLRMIGKVDGFSFQLPMTQQQLGEFTGLSSVHVCRTMRRLSDKNILTTNGKMDIVISDIERLARSAGVGLDTLANEILPN
ncbi:Crp/Fnr family transcriptional regulator [Pseudogemmobacter sp. W21_MBD1_M6]|uniref:Crp/Fnr family transcriptional regulator n=1 Tax=Pseudogemmobacter sp. W21_MBD1_M6 TaxID=3240271 RepID=UPI003F9DC8F8